MPAFIPDIPYHIQLVFAGTFSFIWLNSFTDDYNEPLPADPVKRQEIEKANIWRGIYSVIVFICAFSYLKPYPEYGLSDIM